jgi:hypothetical protein
MAEVQPVKVENIRVEVSEPHLDDELANYGAQGFTLVQVVSRKSFHPPEVFVPDIVTLFFTRERPLVLDIKGLPAAPPEIRVNSR